MAIKVPKSKSFDPGLHLVPKGTHLGVCIGVLDLGTQEKEFEGKVSSARQVLLVWELPGKPRSDGQPFLVSKLYTLSLGKKSALGALLEAWLGERPTNDFDLSSLLGHPGFMAITHITRQGDDGPKTYSNLAGVSQLPDGIAAPTDSGRRYSYEFGGKNKPLPEWLPSVYGKSAQEMIAAAEENQGGESGQSNGDDPTPPF